MPGASASGTLAVSPIRMLASPAARQVAAATAATGMPAAPRIAGLTMMI